MKEHERVLLAEQHVEQLAYACQGFETRVLKAEQDLQTSENENIELRRRLGYLAEREQQLASEAESVRASVDQREKSVIESVAALLGDILQGNEIDMGFLKTSAGFSDFADALEKIQARFGLCSFESQVI